MKEIKLTIDGKEVQLTNEQLKMLGIETRQNPFERVDGDGSYYFINNYADINEDSREDDLLFNSVNYFNDKDFAQQVAFHQLLYRKLLKFTYESECEDVGWNPRHAHWYIYYDIACDKFCISSNDTFKHQGVYFSTRQCAERAIKEVVKPFIKEHPEFVW